MMARNRVTAPAARGMPRYCEGERRGSMSFGIGGTEPDAERAHDADGFGDIRVRELQLAEVASGSHAKDVAEQDGVGCKEDDLED